MAVLQPDGALRVQQWPARHRRGASPDQVAPGWCLRVARSLAPIRDISDDEVGLGLPESSRLLDVLGLEPPAAGGDRRPLGGVRPVHDGRGRGVL